MAERCNISKKGLIKQLKSLIKDLIKLPTVKEQKREYIRGLRFIKSQYSEILSDEMFFDIVSETIQGDDVFMMIGEIQDENQANKLLSILEQGFQGELSTYDPNFVESTLDVESKFDEIDSTSQEKNERRGIKEQFLSEYFPMSSDARLAFQQRFKEKIIHRFFFNDNGSPRINITNIEMDQSIKQYREELIKYIDDYFKNNYPNAWEKLKLRDSSTRIKKFKELLDSGNFSVNPIELIKIPILDSLTDNDLKQKLQAYMAYIALSNFDELILDAFEDSVVILHKNDYETKEIKYRINLGNKAATTWNDDSKDIDETEQIGGIIRLYMESLNMYDGEKRLPFKMTFSDVKSGLGGIMDLFNSQNLSERILTRDYRLDSLLNLKETLRQAGLELFYKNGSFDTIYKEYVAGKTIGQLLAETKQDPALLAPLLFTILAKYSDNFFENRYQIKQTVWSFWKNIFDMNNKYSLLNRTINSGGVNIDSADLYTFITALFVNIENIPVIEYRKDGDDTISAIELKQNTSNSRLNSQKYTWAGIYYAENPQQFKTFTIDDFKESNNSVGNITKIHIKDSSLVLTTQANGGAVSVSIGGKFNFTTTDTDIIADKEILDFLSEVFGTTINKEYLTIFVGLGGKLNDLLNLAGTILYNYKIGKVINEKLANHKSITVSLREVYDKEIEKFYKNNPPDVMRNTLQPELVDKSMYPVIRRFSLAIDIQQGYSGDTTARDGEGKQIALKGLSSLMSKYMELVYNYNLKDEQSILKNFNIYKSFENAYFVRDYAGSDAKKQATQFSEAEFFSANFLYDFYGEQLGVKKDGTRNIDIDSSEDSTKFRIMGPVVSDKNKIPKIQFDWRSKVTLPDGTVKKYYELTPDEIISIQNKEFGDYYEGVHKRIIQDWFNIQPYIAKYIPGAILDFNNDFEIFNKQCKIAGLNPFDVIHNALVDYQKECRSKGIYDYDIRITDNLHYIKGRDGEIHNNPALFHQLNIYGRHVPYKIRSERKITNPDGSVTILNKGYLPNLDIKTIDETPEQARERLNFQLISELLQYDINIRLNGDKTDNAAFIAEKRNKEGVWRNGKLIYFAKIVGGKEDVNLSSLRSFKNWSRYQDLVETLGENLPEDLNINSPRFNLQLTIHILSDLKKIRMLQMTSAKKILRSEYKPQLDKKLKKSSYQDLIREKLQRNNPNWKPETIERKTLEKLNSKSEEELEEELINDIIDQQARAYITSLIAKNSLSKNAKFLHDYKLVTDSITTLNENDENDKKLINSINSPDYSIQINPEVERYHALNNWLGESYMLTSAGTFISHPGDNNARTIFNYEYGNFGQQVKRNVSQTATKHREVQNSLKGIRTKLRIAFIEDEKDSALTFKGDYSRTGIKVHDGATYYNGTMVDLDNNSLGADAMGQDKKPFIHAIDPRTGCAIIVKTAGFAVTNSRIQASERMERLNKKMNHTIKWSETLRRFGYQESYFDWTKDFNGNPLDFKNGWYVQKNGRFFKFSNPVVGTDGSTTVTVQEVYDNGEPKGRLRTAQFGYVNGNFQAIVRSDKGAVDLLGKSIVGDIQIKPIDSNWELWNVFGGAYSAHFSEGHLTSINDEISFKMVNYVMNHTGKVRNENIPKISQSNVLQILKESQIDMIPTMGAGKFGAANINSTQLFDDDNYEAAYMEVFSDDFGEQLNAEHSAEGGHVSLMTQVINALGARGYSRQDAEECYQALEWLAEQAFEEAFDELEKINSKNTEASLEKFKIQVANIILQTLRNTSISDGNILSALSQNLKHIQRFTEGSQLEGVFPISSPQIFAKAFSNLASSLEKSSVRLKFDGGMLVLNPSNRIYKIINGKFSRQVKKEELEELQIDAYNNPLKSSSEIKIGRNYYIISDNGTYHPILVDNIDDFYKVKNAIFGGYRVIEAFCKEIVISQDTTDITGETKKVNFTGYNPLGRDLAPYDCIIGELGTERTFSLYEIDVVRQLSSWDDKTKMFRVQENIPQTNLEIYWNRWQSGDLEVEPLLLSELNKLGIKEINPNLMHSFLERSLQEVLNTVDKNSIGRSVIIDNERIKIDPNKTYVSSYEAVLPMIYKTSFGLRDGDTVGDIENDEYFFVKRFLDNSSSKFKSTYRGELSIDGDQFDFELKRTSGDHIYIVHPNKMIDGTVIRTVNYDVIGGVLYRVDSNGKKMYQVPSKEENGKLVPNCRILKTANGVEVIETTDFLTILEQGGYNTITFGNFENSSSYIRDILEQLEQSSDKSAKNKVKYILNAISKKVATNKEGLKNGNRLYIDSIGRDKKLAKEYLKAPEQVNSISEIFENEAYLNALEHHELYTIDAKNQQEKLDELKSILEYVPEKLDEFLEKYPHFRHVIDYGLEQHTSFLTSLEAIVSRTPAQSHQSFMAMKIVGFDSNIINSIYVNRMQLFLQGSDYDIDKANFLGLKFHNGILVTWSPYYDLTSASRSRQSESLPFPSGNSLLVNESPTKLPFNVIEKNYTKAKTEIGFVFTDNNGNQIIANNTEKGKWELIFIPNEDGLSINTYLLQHAVIKNIPKGDIIIPNGALDLDTFKLDDNGRLIEIDEVNDIKLYLDSLDLSKSGNKFNNLDDVSQLIRTFTKMGEIPSQFYEIKKIVDEHNTYFCKNGKKNNKKDRLKRSALYNFISIKARNISKNPVNLIQGQSGIDIATDNVKDLVKPGKFYDPENPNVKLDRLSTIPVTSDHRSIVARMHQLVLTLTGKESVGIVASAMKVFEAMSHYYNKILAEGTEEEQKRLISNIKIMGRSLPLIANSFVKNRDTLQNESIEKAYDTVNNFQDAFIMMSALLSLATDNAKDPTLPKLNATPETIGCYTAGLVLGLTISDVAELLISDTGLLLANMVKDNVFNPKINKFNHLSDAIKFIITAPKAPENIDLRDFLEMFGLWSPKNPDKPRDPTDVPNISKILWSKRNRSRFKQMAMYILHSDTFELETDNIKLAKRELRDIEEDPLYWGWNETKENEYKTSTGKKRENLQEEYNQYIALRNLKKSYEAYIENPDSKLAADAKREVERILDISKKYSKGGEKEIAAKKLSQSTLGVSEFLQSVFEWINYHEIVDKDKITRNGEQYSILSEIRKLNSFNDEMGDLRGILKLNQGIPNSVQDQHSWINTFRNILSKAVKRQNRKINEESNTPLAKFVKKYKSLELDLNLFLYDDEYQKDAIEAYESVKVAVNILDVMLGIPHYRGYMKTMNLLYEGSKAVSLNYKTQSNLVKTILPKLGLKTKEQREKFFKTLNPVIFERINNLFLRQTQTEYQIPKFKIENGRLIESRDDKGKLQFESIKLGTESGNQKFKEYCVHYLFPYLKQNFPDNAFVQAIALRTYGYNSDHQISINIAKRQSYNMSNLTENVQFNEIKKALMELNGIDGLIRALFYYNLIAYNGQPGMQALTDFFEDFLVYDNNTVISEYNDFITYLDESDIDLFDESDEDYLLKVFAPEVFTGENVEGMSYIWITNPENNKKILLKYVGDDTSDQQYEGDDEENYNPYIDDNEFGEYSKYDSYKTLASVMTNWLKNKWMEEGVSRKSSSDKKFILGKEILEDVDQIFKLYNEEYKTKKITQLTEDKRHQFLKKHSDKIILNINGEKISLKQLISRLKDKGWNEKDILNIFRFVSRKSNGYVYETLETGTLKTRLENMLNNDNNNCNG